MPKIRALFVLCSLVAVGPFANGIFANLVNNGGFETGDFTSWTTQPAAAGSFFFVTPEPHSGAFSAQFQAVADQYDQISQILATNAGSKYTISFWIKNYGVGGDSLKVSWEGSAELEMTPVGTPLEDWVEISFQVTANSSGSELRFGGYDGPSAFLIDDINVTVVPEASTLALAGLGAIAAAVAYRRRSK